MMKAFNADWEVKRAFVAFARSFAALSLFIAVFTPFLPEEAMEAPMNRWVALLVGLGYSALFSFFVTGLCLLPKHTRSRVITGMSWGVIVLVLWEGAILASIYFQPSLGTFHRIAQPFPWVAGAYLAVAFAFACYGWYHCLFDRLPRPESQL